MRTYGGPVPRDLVADLGVMAPTGAALNDPARERVVLALAGRGRVPRAGHRRAHVRVRLNRRHVLGVQQSAVTAALAAVQPSQVLAPPMRLHGLVVAGRKVPVAQGRPPNVAMPAALTPVHVSPTHALVVAAPEVQADQGRSRNVETAAVQVHAQLGQRHALVARGPWGSAAGVVSPVTQAPEAGGRAPRRVDVVPSRSVRRAVVPVRPGRLDPQQAPAAGGQTLYVCQQML